MLLLLASALAADLDDILAVELSRGTPSTLSAYVSDEDPAVRARTALALGRLKDADAVGSLTTLVGDPDPTVRHHAAFGLGLTPDSTDAILDALATEAAPLVRAELFRALGMQLAGLDALVAGLSEDGVAAEGAAQGIGRHALAKSEGVTDVEVVQGLLDQIPRLRYPGLRQAAAFALGRMAPETMDEAHADGLVHHIERDHDPTVRSYLVRAGAKANGAAVVAACVDDWDTGVRVACARAIGVNADASLIPALETLLEDSAWSVQMAAISASATLDVDHAVLLKPFLEGEDEDLMVTAIAALAMQDGANVRPFLDPDQPSRGQAAAMGGVDDPDQLQRLATLSQDGAVRVAAASRLSDVEHGAEHALALLKSTDAVIVAVGVSMLGGLEDPVYGAEIGQAMLDHGDIDVQLEGLKALAKLPPTRRPDAALVLAVTQSQTHPSLAVRQLAEPLAEQLGLAPPPPFATPLPDLEPTLAIVGARILTDAGELRVSLRPDVAPMTVHNFATLAEDDYFDGLEFHRVVPDFVIQDGCPRGDGWGGPGHTIPDELSWLPYDEGTLGMALSGPDSGGSQWFITLSPQPHLDANYTVFGHLDYGKGTLQSVHVGTVIEDVIIERDPNWEPPKDTSGQPQRGAERSDEQESEDTGSD